MRFFGLLGALVLGACSNEVLPLGTGHDQALVVVVSASSQSGAAYLVDGSDPIEVQAPGPDGAAFAFDAGIFVHPDGSPLTEVDVGALSVVFEGAKARAGSCGRCPLGRDDRQLIVPGALCPLPRPTTELSQSAESPDAIRAEILLDWGGDCPQARAEPTRGVMHPAGTWPVTALAFGAGGLAAFSQHLQLLFDSDGAALVRREQTCGGAPLFEKSVLVAEPWLDKGYVVGTGIDQSTTLHWLGPDLEELEAQPVSDFQLYRSATRPQSPLVLSGQGTGPLGRQAELRVCNVEGDKTCRALARFEDANTSYRQMAFLGNGVLAASTNRQVSVVERIPSRAEEIQTMAEILLGTVSSVELAQGAIAATAFEVGAGRRVAALAGSAEDVVLCTVSESGSGPSEIHSLKITPSAVAGGNLALPPPLATCDSACLSAATLPDGGLVVYLQSGAIVQLDESLAPVGAPCVDRTPTSIPVSVSTSTSAFAFAALDGRVYVIQGEGKPARWYGTDERRFYVSLGVVDGRLYAYGNDFTRTPITPAGLGAPEPTGVELDRLARVFVSEDGTEWFVGGIGDERVALRPGGSPVPVPPGGLRSVPDSESLIIVNPDDLFLLSAGGEVQPIPIEWDDPETEEIEQADPDQSPAFLSSAIGSGMAWIGARAGRVVTVDLFEPSPSGQAYWLGERPTLNLGESVSALRAAGPGRVLLGSLEVVQIDRRGRGVEASPVSDFRLTSAITGLLGPSSWIASTNAATFGHVVEDFVVQAELIDLETDGEIFAALSSARTLFLGTDCP